MELARVIGRCVATVKHPGLEGVRLLIIQPQDASGQPTSEPIFAADPLQAGPGDVVAWVQGREAACALPERFTPVDAAVVGIVDQVWRESGEGA